MLVEIRNQKFVPWQELAAYEKKPDIVPGSFGACAAFVGTMRDFNKGDKVQQLHLEHYEGMTEKLLSDYAQSVVDKFSLLDLLIIHRVGDITPSDPIVLVAAWSAHRSAAFDGCREMMEYLKSKATFWKKETVDSEQRWVEQ